MKANGSLLGSKLGAGESGPDLSAFDDLPRGVVLMTDAALLELLRAELPLLLRQAVRAELAAQQNPLTKPQQRALLALVEVFGVTSFASCEVADELHSTLDTDTRREYRAALLALCRGQPATSQRIGHALRAIVDAGGQAGGWKLVDDGAEAGVRRWRIEGTASL